MAARRAELESTPSPAPAPPPPAPPQGPQPKRRSFRGDYGRQAIVQDVDIIELEDWRKLPDWIFEAEAVREAIVKVARPMVKQKVAIPGLKVTRDVKTSTRK